MKLLTPNHLSSPNNAHPPTTTTPTKTRHFPYRFLSRDERWIGYHSRAVAKTVTKKKQVEAGEAQDDSYQALYRKYRPQRFDEVVGQEHITDTLKREVVEGKVGHAFLFTGPRGTGKTSTARILAKALNCQNRGQDGEPDNACEACEEITDGHSMDVMELDAASHNSVDDIREIRQTAVTVSSSGKSKRIYILDEAHQLSKAACNALLKILEEPPPHVIFVLATTEPYRLLPTIHSRSQRFDFHPLTTDKLTENLAVIAKKENYQAKPDALQEIARRALGSVRDSLSLLEQVASLGEGEVTKKKVFQGLGLAGIEKINPLVEGITNRDTRAVLEVVAEVVATGGDIRRFLVETMRVLRGVFLTKYSQDPAEIVDDPPVVIEQWREVAQILDGPQAIQIIDRLGDALLEIRRGREDRLMLELALIKLSSPETDPKQDLVTMQSRIAALEAGMVDGEYEPPATPSSGVGSVQLESLKQELAQQARKQYEQIAARLSQQTKENQTKLAEQLKSQTAASLKEQLAEQQQLIDQLFEQMGYPQAKTPDGLPDPDSQRSEVEEKSTVQEDSADSILQSPTHQAEMEMAGTVWGESKKKPELPEATEPISTDERELPKTTTPQDASSDDQELMVDPAPTSEPPSPPPSEDISESGLPGLTYEQVAEVWSKLQKKIRDFFKGRRRWGYFQRSKLGGVDHDTVILYVDSIFHFQAINKDGTIKAIVETTLGDMLERSVNVRFVLVDPDSSSSSTGSSPELNSDLDSDPLEQATSNLEKEFGPGLTKADAPVG